MRCMSRATCFLGRTEYEGIEGPKYQREDGVSCEACHGAAKIWLENHVGREYKDLLKEGMYDTVDLVKRAEKCVSCHVGDEGERRNVDHELIAAGHPDLVFELDTFTSILPPHWRLPKRRVVAKPGLWDKPWPYGKVLSDWLGVRNSVPLRPGQSLPNLSVSPATMR